MPLLRGPASLLLFALLLLVHAPAAHAAEAKLKGKAARDSPSVLGRVRGRSGARTAEEGEEERVERRTCEQLGRDVFVFAGEARGLWRDGGDAMRDAVFMTLYGACRGANRQTSAAVATFTGWARRMITLMITLMITWTCDGV